MPEIRKTYSEDTDHSSVVFHLTEENLGLNQHNDLNDEILREISTGTCNFNFDLNDLGSINSSGLGTLISCLKIVKEKNCKLKLINVSDKISNVFKLTKLDNVFDLGKQN